MLRVPYTCKARLFRDSDAEVTIRWYRVPFSNGTLPFDTAVNSDYWVSQPWTRTGPGEVIGDRRRFDGRPPPVIVTTGHVCGTPDDFLLGCVFNDQIPPVTYGRDGIPECCRVGPKGVVIGGKAALLDRTTGVVLGGRVDPLSQTTGVVVGGRAGVLSDTTGVLLGGDAEPVPTPGAVCADAATIEEGVTYEYSIGSGSQWFTIVATATGLWHLDYADDGLGVLSLAIYQGGVCPLPIPVAFVTPGPPCWEWNTTAGDVIRFQFTYVSGSPTYTFTTGTGGC